MAMYSRLKLYLKPQEMNVLFIGGRFHGTVDRVPWDTMTIEDFNVDHEALQAEMNALDIDCFDVEKARAIQERHTKSMGKYEKKGIKAGFVIFVHEDWKGQL